MEEILASIRRIIADDQAFLSSRSPAEPPPDIEPFQMREEPRQAWTPTPSANLPRADLNAGAPPPMQPVLAAPAQTALAQAVPHPVQSSPTPPSAPAIPWPLRVSAAEPQRAAAPFEAPSVPPPHEVPEPAQSPVAPPEAEEHVATASDDATAAPMSAEDTDAPLISAATDASVSAAFNALLASRFLNSTEHLNELVRECLRPMLKTWLDDNLPILVERLVRAEIERVARGGR